MRFVTRWRSPFLGHGRFGNWEDLPGLPPGRRFAGDPSVIADKWGRLVLFVRVDDGRVWQLWQATPGREGWLDAWQPLGQAQVAGDPVPGRNQDGRLEVFARDRSGRLFQIWQSGPDLAFVTDWMANGAAGYTLAEAGQPDVITAGARLHVAVRDRDDRAHVVYQAELGQRWTDVRLSDDSISSVADPALGENAGGRLELVSKAAHDIVTHRWQPGVGRW